MCVMMFCVFCSRFIYPLVVTVIITAATCPQSLGQYMGGGVSLLTHYCSVSVTSLYQSKVSIGSTILWHSINSGSFCGDYRISLAAIRASAFNIDLITSCLMSRWIILQAYTIV